VYLVAEKTAGQSRVDLDVPVVGGWRPQREAAARNEAKIIEAARGLLESGDAQALEMRAVADAAGVGVGTLYRRFGDKAQLLSAIVGADEREVQEAVLRGPPPIGPGAPAATRLTAFLDALVDLTERNLNVLLVTDSTPPGRLGIGAYAAWRVHISLLLQEIRPAMGKHDAGWYADLLLSALDPQLYAKQRRCDRLSRRRIAENLRNLAQAICPTP
jgi:AcrR family transcriptional regulator